MSLNSVTVMGRLTADPELKHTQSGVAVSTLRLAVDRDFKDKDGNRECDFLPVVCWRGTAEFAARYFSKGQWAIVKGRLQVRDFTTQTGEKRSVTEIVAESLYFTDNKQKEKPDPFYPVDDDEDLPFD